MNLNKLTKEYWKIIGRQTGTTSMNYTTRTLIRKEYNKSEVFIVFFNVPTQLTPFLKVKPLGQWSSTVKEES